jgi:hypothetical protein
MDPNIWSKLPFDILEHIAGLADIDTRRAMGFKPLKLPRIEFNPRPMPTSEYRYYTREKKLWYFEMVEYGNLYFDVITGVELVDPRVPLFRYMDYARQRITIYSNRVNRYEEFQVHAPSWQLFQTAGVPIWIA